MVAVHVESGHTMAAEWTLCASALILMCLRCYCRLRLHGSLKTWYDFFAILSWLCFFAMACQDTVLYRNGYFDGAMPNGTTLRISYVEGPGYFWPLYSVKASMLCFYTDLVPRCMDKTRTFMWITIGITVVGFITSQCVALFYCHPISRNFTPDENFCSSSWSTPSIATTYTFHFLTDLLVYSIPMPVISALNLSRRQKVGVFILFGMGFIVIAFGASNVAAAFLPDVDLGFSWVLGSLEISWAVFIVCAPSLKYFIARRGRVGWIDRESQPTVEVFDAASKEAAVVDVAKSNNLENDETGSVARTSASASGELKPAQLE